MKFHHDIFFNIEKYTFYCKPSCLGPGTRAAPHPARTQHPARHAGPAVARRLRGHGHSRGRGVHLELPGARAAARQQYVLDPWD